MIFRHFFHSHAFRSRCPAWWTVLLLALSGSVLAAPSDRTVVGWAGQVDSQLGRSVPVPPSMTLLQSGPAPAITAQGRPARGARPALSARVQTTSYVGIGVSVGAAPSATPGVMVNYLVPGSPAARTGMRLYERIVTLDGHDVTHRSVAQVQALLRGSGRPGTTVTLGLQATGSSAVRIVTLTRARIQLP